MNNNYVVGLDFGTLSGRAVVVRASDGAEMGAAVHEYPHGVMDRPLSLFSYTHLTLPTKA